MKISADSSGRCPAREKALGPSVGLNKRYYLSDYRPQVHPMCCSFLVAWLKSSAKWGEYVPVLQFCLPGLGIEINRYFADRCQMFDFVKKAEKIRPAVARCVGGAVQGYAFGCVIGLFTQKREPGISAIALDAHCVGKKFAMVGAIYSATEAVLEKYQGRRPVNGVIASAVSGALAQRKSGVASMVTTAAAFTLYNGAYQAYDLK